jgi:dihydrofolate reductase
MGRNKFGPELGLWADEEWKGWWGDDPPFHTPVYVLTHYQRPSIQMTGGTTFHFIDTTPIEALKLAQEAAGGRDIRIGGGPSTIRQFLAANLIDYMHVVIVPLSSVGASVFGTGWRSSNSASIWSRSALQAASPHLTLNRR